MKFAKEKKYSNVFRKLNPFDSFKEPNNEIVVAAATAIFIYTYDNENIISNIKSLLREFAIELHNN